MNNLECQDKKYSTTKLVISKMPIIKTILGDKFNTMLFMPEGKGRKGEGGLRMKGCFKCSYDNKPLISVITVVFNGEKYLEETIQSILNQTYDNVEYIIIDGGSTDSTLDIIKKYNEQIDYWISESDKGIYDAMNKGISLASGDLIGIISSDDWLNNSIGVIAKNYKENYDVDIFHGNLQFYKSKHISETCKPNIDFKVMEVLGMSYNHPTFFVHKNVYKNIRYDIKYKILSDYKFTMETLKNGYQYYYINDIIAHMRSGGVSATFYQRIKEGHMVRLELGYGIWFTWYSTFIRVTLTILSNLKQFVKNYINV